MPLPSLPSSSAVSGIHDDSQASASECDSLALLLWRLRKIRSVCSFWRRSCSPDAQRRRVIWGFASCIVNRQGTVACPNVMRVSETVCKGRLVLTGKHPLCRVLNDLVRPVQATFHTPSLLPPLFFSPLFSAFPLFRFDA